MLDLLSISAKQLCRILSADKSELNQFELAIREALEKANTEVELRAIREHACLTDDLANIQFNAKGRPLRI